MSNDLIVVDVQQMFSGYFNESYLDKVKAFIENNQWDNIVCIYNEKEHRDEEEKLEYVPNWLATAATQVICKSVHNNAYEHYTEDLLHYGYKEEKPNTAWRKDTSLLIRTPTVHEFFFVPDKLQLVSGCIRACTLIGGAVDYCLEDIKTALEYLGVHVKIDKRYTYALGEWSNEPTQLEWVSTKNKAN